MEQLIQWLDAGDEQHNKFTTYFKPLQIIGQGAFGKVVQAVDILTHQELAIKVIHKKKMGEDCIERVKQEANILEKLNHPNVIQFKKVCETETKVLIAMELVKGGSLAELMKEKKNQKEQLKEKEVSQIMKSIMSGLTYIHGKNIVHRDLKPANILISDVNDYSTVKIADFGLSSAFSLCTTNGLTEQCGTLLYMAPEFFVSRTYSKQIDVWSCGIIMYNLLDNGNHPFYDPKNDDPHTFKQKLISPKWNIPSNFSSLAKNLLQKLSLINPTDRYSAVQVLQHPFITEKQNGDIPMTMNEQLVSVKIKEILSQKIQAMMFMQHLKNLQKASNLQKQQQIVKDYKQIDLTSHRKYNYKQNSSYKKNLSEVSTDFQESASKLKTEQSNSDESYSFRSKIKNNNHYENQLSSDFSPIENQTQQSTQNNSNNHSQVRKQPMNFMIKQQKNLNHEHIQQQHANIKIKRNSVLNSKQENTDNSILIEIEETSQDQQGSYCEKKIKQQQMVQQIVQHQPIYYHQNQYSHNQIPSSQKSSPILIQHSPGKSLMNLQANRPQTETTITTNTIQNKRKQTLHPSQNITLTQLHIKKENNSPVEVCLSSLPRQKNEQQGNSNNPNFFQQMRIKSATRVKQDVFQEANRRHSNLNKISSAQIKKLTEHNDQYSNNFYAIQEPIVSPKSKQTPISPFYQHDNRNYVQSQIQINNARISPQVLIQIQEASSQLEQTLKSKHPQQVNQLYPKNKIPLRGSDKLNKKQSFSVNREDDKKNNQNNMYGFPQINVKEKHTRLIAQQTEEMMEQEKDAVQKGILKGYLMNTKSRQNNLIQKRLQI